MYYIYIERGRMVFLEIYLVDSYPPRANSIVVTPT